MTPKQIFLFNLIKSKGHIYNICYDTDLLYCEKFYYSVFVKASKFFKEMKCEKERRNYHKRNLENIRRDRISNLKALIDLGLVYGKWLGTGSMGMSIEKVNKIRIYRIKKND